LIEDKKAVNVTVISNIPNIIKLISELYPSSQTLLVENNSLKPYDLHKQKLLYRNKFNSIEGCNVYFFFVAYGIIESYAIKILSRKNKIFYKKSVDTSHFKKTNSIKSKLWKLYLGFMLGIQFNPRLIDDNLVFAVSDEFLSQLNVQDIVLLDNIEHVKKRIIDQYHLSNKRVLFTVGGVVEDNLVKKEEYVHKNDILIRYLSDKYGRDQIALKMHPRYTHLFSDEVKFNTIPNYIPGNLIIDNFEIIIGYSSAILFEAANLGKKVYSTLKYFEPNNYKTQNQYVEYLSSNLEKKSTIKFFKELDIFESNHDVFVC
jgi:hypothetical protein